MTPNGEKTIAWGESCAAAQHSMTLRDEEKLLTAYAENLNFSADAVDEKCPLLTSGVTAILEKARVIQ